MNQASTATSTGATMGATTATTSSASSSWDSLRREARKLENELDMKLAHATPGAGTSSQTEKEIEVLLQRLKSVNAALQSDASLHPSGNHGVLAQRHADIFQDYSSEFARLVSNSGLNTSARMELLRGGNSMASSSGQSTSNKGLLLRERTALDRAHGGIDNVLLQAHGVASGLAKQKDIFTSVDSRLSQLGVKFPVMNSMLNAIRRKKNRDALVLSGVGGALIFLMLVYWINK